MHPMLCNLKAFSEWVCARSNITQTVARVFKNSESILYLSELQQKGEERQHMQANSNGRDFFPGTSKPSPTLRGA